jgi:arsenite methyltransferase
MSTADLLREQVRERYAQAAVAAETGGCGCTESGGCCGNVSCEGDDASFGEALYTIEQRRQLPNTAALASLGCGNPTSVPAEAST